MTLYIMKRLALMLPMLLIISFLTFVLTHLSKEDPAVIILHAKEVPTITDQLLVETRVKYGLDQPFLMQYWHWLTDALQFNFGHSYVTDESVGDRILPAFWNTLKLTLVSSIFIIILSVILGVFTAIYRGTFFDRSIRIIAFILTAIPSYLMASIFIIFISVKLNILPTSGLTSAMSYVLPVTVIVIGYVGIYFRNVRSSMIHQLNQDYVLYARASGIKQKHIIMHVLRNAMQVAISIFCMSIPIILGGTVVIENIFAWPGLGQLSVKAILERDFPFIQAYVLIISVLFVLFNTLADVINAYLNPKLREGS